MFFNLLWKFRYYRLMNKLTDINDIYHDRTFVMDMVKLGSQITERDVNASLYSTNVVIATSFPRVSTWLEQVTKISKQIIDDSLTVQPIYPRRSVTLEDYLLTENNHRVEPYSAFSVVGENLIMLHDIIGHHNEDRREFFYKQNRELFQDGLIFYLKILEYYAGD